MADSRKKLGRWGERFAAQYLHQEGYEVLDQNVYTPYGEIDLVARQVGCGEDLPRDQSEASSSESSEMLVFVEVKTRSSEVFGQPEDAITTQKRTHLLSSAQAYLQAHPEYEGDWRIDVISIRRFRSGESPELFHFENAIT